MDNKNSIFALDIGTRSIIGLVCIPENEKLKIMASELIEHEKRTMYDGQIHDIEGVSKIVSKVKTSLESKLGFKLKRVAIAAAGRSLKASSGNARMNVDFTREIDRTSIESLELEAIQNAQAALSEDPDSPSAKYYCVGHSVSAYYLDGNYMESLDGHRGEEISVEVLATFLPNIVVDSLYSVMDRVGLEVESLTLEPIAAINIAIKKNMRLLNLAMVDIGAGTCDIAITNNGTISSYAMVPGAGDNITEAIARAYLLDFDTAESVKKQLSSNDEVKFSDIVGIEHSISSQEIIESISDEINDMGIEISKEILRYNTKSPGAVFLVGGASQIPTLSKVIAKELGIPEERVVIKDSSTANEFENISDELKGPQAITPLGIALEHSMNSKKNFMEISFNENTIRMFNSKPLAIADALVLSAFNPRNLIPKSGDEFNYTLNGVKKSISGNPGTPARILLNGKDASLSDMLSDGDEVQVISAKKGTSRSPGLHECLKLEGYNDSEIKNSSICVNGIVANSNITLSEGDSVSITLDSDLDIEEGCLEEEPFDKDFNAHECDHQITSEPNEDICESEPSKDASPFMQTISLVVNGESLCISHSKKTLVLTDIFEHIDFDISKPKGFLTFYVNGIQQGFNYALKNGDSIKIFWK